MPTKNTTKPRKVLSSSRNSPRTVSEAQQQPQKGAPLNPMTGDALSWHDERNQIPRLTLARAKELVGEILVEDEDVQAENLIELLTGIAYEMSDNDRDSLAFVATREACTLTHAFSSMVQSFAHRAATRVRTPFSRSDQRKGVSESRFTGPHGENPDEGYHVEVGDEIILEIQLKVESVGQHPGRTFVVGRAADGSMVTFDEGAARGIFWDWD